SLQAGASLIEGWGAALSAEADLLIYGCNLAANEAGESLVNDLGRLTGADVAASDDLTGSAALGGDWVLEYQTGQVETGIAVSQEVMESWSNVMVANFTVTTTAAAGPGSLSDAITQANAAVNSGGADTIHFNIGGGGQQTINVAPGGLPAISEAVVIDATTQPGYSGTPLIELSAASTGTADGLVLAAGSDGSTIRGLSITGFDSGQGAIVINSDFNLIAGNYLGVRPDGSTPDGNTRGIDIVGGANNTIGGTGVSDRNVIADSSLAGVKIANAGATGNVVLGNYIGTNANGTAAIGNFNGVFIDNGATDNTIGGITPGSRNIISGNTDDGLEIQGSSTSGNTVIGNYIGTDVTGLLALGNADYGVLMDQAPNNTIGGTTAAERNIISANLNSGVLITGGTADFNTIQGNYIGVAVDGTTARPNAGGGVRVNGGADNNLIGGAADGAGNLIAANTGSGVQVDGAGTTGNAIRENLVYSNSGIAIDLVSSGNLGRQDPNLSSVTSNGVDTVTIDGNYSDPAMLNQTLTIEYFSNPGNDREGRTYLDSDTINTDNFGNATFSSSLSAMVAVNEYVTATVTDASGNTSEFSMTEAAVANAATSTNAGSLWFSTSGAGDAGSLTWNDNEVVQFSNPNLKYDPQDGTTDGTFSLLPGFSAPYDIRAMHYVGSAITIGTTGNQTVLQKGDLLLTLDPGNTEVTAVGVTFDRHDILLFRPTVAGDYSSGAYTMLLDEGIHDDTEVYNSHAITLVEQDTLVGSTLLQAGTLIVARSTPAEHDNLYVISVIGTGTGAATQTDDMQLLLDGDLLGLSDQQIQGLELIENSTTIGTETLAPGTLLMALRNSSPLVVAGSVSVEPQDVFYLNVSSTEIDAPGSTAATATLLFDGSDVGMEATPPLGQDERINALALLAATGTPTADASAGASYTIAEGGSLSLDGSASSDSNGTITAYAWDIGNNGSFEKTGVNANYSWAELNAAGVNDDGSFDIALRVTDNEGGTATQVFTLTVSNTAPTISLTGSGEAVSGNSYTLNLGATDPGD
ncbi:MAG: DUF4347 domain-containing protein, partial [Gammaproteobacteria bacterium]